MSAFHSQEEALRRNAAGRPVRQVSVLDPLSGINRGLLRIPKSLDLFAVYLDRIAAAAGPGLIVAAGFMTRHFTPRLLEVAGGYADTVAQTRARKKARLLVLSDFRGERPEIRYNELAYGGVTYRQHPGVFSGNHIDYATQFLLTVWEKVESGLSTPTSILDIACGNGIIGDQLLRRYSEARLTATDDSLLAVRSAKMNLPADRSRILYDHTLDQVVDRSIDLVVSNPPFHFGHENNIDVSLGLFRQARRVLREGGSLVVVANRHLNYATHLEKLFRATTVAETDKYVVYRADKVG
ncbi:16S rRNA G1207 methylase RsmC [Lewinella aquimaris]|uniref:16S rRNA G1207 methylase RsmC n=1 Tax=Neolewinella aquimaris TaxID=1835722 RepID=A0A840E3G2_9BACT|nr:class I SAM-dependent methyltransferase [Neolewinella aquimaris]MBB4077597.1 16S rRNA G1207 methylase RsmC [Neolewinella aquimaris]